MAAIAYPSFAEHILALRTQYTCKEIAQLLDPPVQEEAVIRWSEGHAPGLQLLGRIERCLEYSFDERQFADAAEAAGFPPALCDAEIAAMRTWKEVHAYLEQAVTQTTAKNVAHFLGINPSSFSATVHRAVVPEIPTLTMLLRKLPLLPATLRGSVLAQTTPRRVLGQLIRRCRQQRSMSYEQYGKHAASHGVSIGIPRQLEDIARGLRDPEHRQGYFKRDDEHAAILRFIAWELRDLGWTSAHVLELDDAVPMLAETEVAADERFAVRNADPMTHQPPETTARMGESTTQHARDRATVPQSSRQSGIVVFARGLQQRVRDIIDTHSVRMAARYMGLSRRTISRFVSLDAPERISTESLERIDQGMVRYDAAQRGDAPPGDASLGARLVALEHTVAELTTRVHATPPPNGRADRPVRPLSSFAPGALRVHDDVVTDAEIADTRTMLEHVVADLTHYAGIRHDDRRWDVQRALGPLVDGRLFAAVEGFLRSHPNSAQLLEWLDGLRRFAQERHDKLQRLAGGQTAAPDAPRSHNP